MTDHSRVRSAALAVAALTAVVGLCTLGRGELAAPPIESLDAFADWVDANGAVVAGFALLRISALLGATYVLLVAMCTFAASFHPSARVHGALDRVAVPALRRFIGGAGLASLVAIGSAHPAAADGAPRSSDRMVEVPLEADSASPGPSDSSPPPSTDEQRPVMMHEVAPPPLSSTTLPATTTTAAPATTAPPRPATPAPRVVSSPPPAAPIETTPARPTTWTVKPGDSFWSIASELRSEAVGRPVSDAELIDHWKTLVDVNRSKLVTPSPDLIFAGMVLTVPPSLLRAG